MCLELEQGRIFFRKFKTLPMGIQMLIETLPTRPEPFSNQSGSRRRGLPVKRGLVDGGGSGRKILEVLGGGDVAKFCGTDGAVKRLFTVLFLFLSIFKH